MTTANIVPGASERASLSPQIPGTEADGLPVKASVPQETLGLLFEAASMYLKLHTYLLSWEMGILYALWRLKTPSPEARDLRQW